MPDVEPPRAAAVSPADSSSDRQAAPAAELGAPTPVERQAIEPATAPIPSPLSRAVRACAEFFISESRAAGAAAQRLQAQAAVSRASCDAGCDAEATGVLPDAAKQSSLARLYENSAYNVRLSPLVNVGSGHRISSGSIMDCNRNVVVTLSVDQKNAVEKLREAAAQAQQSLGPTVQVHALLSRVPPSPPREPRTWSGTTAAPVALFSPTLAVPLNTLECEARGDAWYANVLRNVATLVNVAMDGASSASVATQIGGGGDRERTMVSAENVPEDLTALAHRLGKKVATLHPAVPQWYKDRDYPAAADLAAIDSVVCPRAIWSASGKKLENMIRMTLLVCKTAASRKGPLAYGDFTPPHFPRRVDLSVAAGGAAAGDTQPVTVEGCAARRTINLSRGIEASGSSPAPAKVRAPTVIAKHCSASDRDWIIRATLATLLQREPWILASYKEVELALRERDRT